MSLRRLVVALLALAVIGAGGWLLWRSFGRAVVRGSVARLEQWCGRQLQTIANDHLGPTLSFDTLDYVFPRTVTLAPVSLTAEGVSIVEADSIRIDFAEVPRVGRPVVIEAARFERPVVRLIERDDGSLLGFSGFVKTGGGRDLPDGGSTRLSEVLAITLLEVDRGAVSYEQQGRPPMRLRPLTFELHHERPAAGDAAAEPGWYAFDARLALEPVAHLDVDSRLNLDTAVLDVGRAVLGTSLTPARYEVFTPEVQEILRRYEIVGDLEWDLSGRVPLRDAAASRIDTHLSLTGASISFGSYVLPMRSLELTATLSEGVLDVGQATVETLGGRARLTLRVWLEGPTAGSFEAQGEGQGLRLEQALKHEEGIEPKHRGEGAFHVEVGGSLEDLAGTFGGSGDLSVAEGHLAIVNLFGDLLSIAGERRDRDRLSADFELMPDRVRWSDAKVSSDVLGIAGGGVLFYDGRLDLMLSVGPLQGREGVLGVVGETVGIVTDRLVRYQVTGTLEDPKVGVRPLDLGPAREEKEEAERTRRRRWPQLPW
jgi:hypothetical protein